MTSDPVAKGLAEDLEVAGAGPIHCHFPSPLLSLPCVVPNVIYLSGSIFFGIIHLLCSHLAVPLDPSKPLRSTAVAILTIAVDYTSLSANHHTHIHAYTV